MRGEDNLEALLNEPDLAEAVEEVKFCQSCWPLPSPDAPHWGHLVCSLALSHNILISKAQELSPCSELSWGEGTEDVYA